METYFQRLEERRNEVDSWFSANPMMRLEYETMISDYEGTMSVVQDFLGIDRMTLQPLTRKQCQRSMRDSVINYDELKNYFESTSWSSFFDE